MLLETSRVKKSRDGLIFYEPDLLLDDYIFETSSILKTRMKYNEYGFGFAIIKYKNENITRSGEMILCRLYSDGIKVYSKRGLSLTEINQSPYTIDINNEYIFEFIKQDKKVILLCDGKQILDIEIDSSYDKYCFGIYSNTDNIILDYTLKYNIPQKWIVNAHKSGGSYVRFDKNKFSILNSIIPVEVENFDTKLKPGYYFLNYTKSQNCDIEAKVYEIDSNQNLMIDNHMFKIEGNANDEKRINIRFCGTHGEISNISINDKIINNYVPTKSGSETKMSSYISINTNNLDFIDMDVNISSVNNNSYIIKNGFEIINKDALLLELNQNYHIKISLKSKEILVYKNEAKYNLMPLDNITSIMDFLYETNCILYSLILTRNNGDKIDALEGDSGIKKIVPYNISSPILVYDENDGAKDPLDISSSYRIRNGLYIFTNWEREYFTPSKKIQLQSQVNNNNIKMFGINIGADYDLEKINYISNNDINDIGPLCNSYSSSVIYEYDEISNSIEIKDYDKYELIVIDYEKKDSYAINYNVDINQYEISISSTKENLKLIYDQVGLQNIDNIVNNPIKKRLNIEPKNNNFIAIRKELK